MTRQLLFLSLLCFIVFENKAQEFPIYYQSQYLMNPVLINPAISGVSGHGSLNLSVRSVAGDKLSPTTAIASFHSRLGSGSNVGLGGILFNDSDGPFHKTGLQAAYAYHLPIGGRSSESSLSFGISASATRYSINAGNVQADKLLYEENHGITPDVNLGTYFNTPQFFAGISANNILESSFKTKNDGLEEVAVNREFFLFTGYNIELTSLTVQPSILAKANEDDFSDVANIFDYNLKFLMEQFIVGASYRSDQSVVILGNYKFNALALGIAYTIPMGDLAFRGETEVVLQIDFK